MHSCSAANPDSVMVNPTYDLNVPSLGNSIANLKGSRSIPNSSSKGAGKDHSSNCYEPIHERELDLEFQRSPNIHNVLNSQHNENEKEDGSVSVPKVTQSNSSVLESCKKLESVSCVPGGRERKGSSKGEGKGGFVVKVKPAVSTKPSVKSLSHSIDVEGVAHHTHESVCAGGGGAKSKGSHVLGGVPVLVNYKN